MLTEEGISLHHPDHPFARSVDLYCERRRVANHRPVIRIMRRENETEIIDAVEELQFREYVRIYGGER